MIPLPGCLSEPLKSVSEKILTQLFGFYQLFSYLCRANLIDLRMEKGKRKSGKSLWCLILVLLGIAVKGNAQRNDSVVVAPDSSNFVTASILTISPTNEVYSVFGHTAIRMECPVHQLDYVFTFESDPSVGGFLTFFAGKTEAKFVAVPTREFLRDIKLLGRGVKQNELNLTLHEEQELWRNLDNDMVAGAHRKFNLHNHCVSTALMLIRQSCMNENLEWAPLQGTMLLNNGDLLRHYVKKSEWAEFLFVSFVGAHYEEYEDQDVRICPQNVVTELSRASFVNQIDGTKRPVLISNATELLPDKREDKVCIITPTVLFTILLLLTCLVTLGEWLWQWKRAARWLDIVLLIAQTLVGIILLAIAFGSDVFGHCWNWYLIPFNPIPLILWICLRKQKNYGRVYLLYTVVLVAFLALTPFLSQLDFPHQLITTILAVRCISKVLNQNRKSKE